ncbi:MAG TPA: bifunctional riboflavin kinase/FAD synthetase [Chitinophagaceae bacterium]|nr:bifunctional riboflavin kinase/FAD synthetase [Chitinophagaceae bacterium]
MQVYRHLENLPAFQNAVVTIGTFDGVHLGHLQILQQMKAAAAACNGDTVIITFDPHPREILDSGAHMPLLLNTLPEKIQLLQTQGIGHLVIVPFTLEFSRLSPQEFIRDFLVRYFHPFTVIIGYDHRFGHHRKGNINLLLQSGPLYGFNVVEIPRQVIHHIAVSSTRIRQYLLEAKLDLAAELLGYPYFFSGQVIRGKQIGRTLGYPTANLEPENPAKLIPADGVYLSRILILPDKDQEENATGLLSIGNRPTFSGMSRQIEVFLFDWDKDIYGREIRIILLDFLRSQIRFDSAEALKKQMNKDKEKALQLILERKDYRFQQ